MDMGKALVILKPSSFNEKIGFDLALELEKNGLWVLEEKKVKIDVDFLKKLRGPIIVQSDIRLCLCQDFVPVWIIEGPDVEEKIVSIQEALSKLYRKEKEELFYSSIGERSTRDLSLVEKQIAKRIII